MVAIRHTRSTSDETVLIDSLLRTRTSLQAEQFDSAVHKYLDEIIPKPWGYEFRVYANDFYDVWKLCLFPGEGTSVHCHPRKETALLCLAGSGYMRLLDSEHEVTTGSVVFVGKGVFHSTTNAGADDLHLVEVEVPRNKFDLVRLRDRYGREGTQYETDPVKDAAVLHPGFLTPRSKLRTIVPKDGFRFGIRAGLDLITRPDPHLLFAVALSVADAIDHTITVIPASIARRAVVHEQLYLTISSPAFGSPTSTELDPDQYTQISVGSHPKE
jgi:mannose-6-phosphate isomerase-like protein (cupin superfamily)